MHIAASLTVLTVFALGCLPMRVALRPGSASLQALGVVLGRGLLLGYALGLVTPSLAWLERAWWIPILLWLVLQLWAARREGAAYRDRLGRPDALGCVLATTLAIALFFKVIAEPILAGDARSIWYFHAKILFHADHALDSELWKTRALFFAHVDYPKLNAIWAALWMKHFGFWNEYLPKFSLLLLELPALLWCVGYSRALLTRCLLVIALLLRMEQFLWNGYMDGLVATYGGIGMLYGIRYVQQGRRLDLLTVMVALGLCMSLKNEGAALALCIIIFVALGRIWHARSGVLQSLADPALCLTAIYAMAGFMIWSSWTSAVGVENDLAAAGSKLARMTLRATDNSSLALIWNRIHTGRNLLLLALLLSVALVFWTINHRALARHRAALLVSLGVPALYFVILLLVYLSTPFDLHWHLKFSATRTAIALYTCITVGVLAPMLSEEPAPAEN